MTPEIKRMEAFKAMFPNASASTVAANPHLVAPNGGSGKQNDVQPVLKRKRGKMTGVEQEFGLILETRKRRGEILRYEFQGMTLRWGVDEKTGDSMKYTPDFVVLEFANTETRPVSMSLAVAKQVESSKGLERDGYKPLMRNRQDEVPSPTGSTASDTISIKLIEVKGPHIHYRQQAIARFKGCRAWWPEFSFELHQKQKGGAWKQIL